MAYRDCPHTPGVICDNQSECKRCGWEQKEAKRRLQAIEDGRPVRNRKGLQYFPVKKKSRPSGANAEGGKAK